jgi:cutinase
MKYSLAFAALAGIAAAAPLEVNKRQDVGTVANDLLDDTTCRPYYLIIARGSTEADNIVSLSTMRYSFRNINR